MIEIRGEIYHRYQAIAVDKGKKRPGHKQVIGTAYYLARSDGEANEVARQKLRDAGVTGRYFIYVEPYYPWLDPAFTIHGYIREVKQ